MVDISYSPSTLDVAAGETVRFIFHDDGSVRHDAVVGDAEAPAKHETEVRAAGDGTEAMDAMDHGDVPALTLEADRRGRDADRRQDHVTSSTTLHTPSSLALNRA